MHKAREDVTADRIGSQPMRCSATALPGRWRQEYLVVCQGGSIRREPGRQCSDERDAQHGP